MFFRVGLGKIERYAHKILQCGKERYSMKTSKILKFIRQYLVLIALMYMKRLASGQNPFIFCSPLLEVELA